MEELTKDFRYHLYNYDFILEEIAELAENENYFEDTYEEYLAERYQSKAQSKEECIATIKDILEKGIEPWAEMWKGEKK